MDLHAHFNNIQTVITADLNQARWKKNAMSTYDTDFYQWTQQQAELLRQGALSALDVEHLIEEIETMGRSQRDATGSHLVIVMMHLLKWKYQPERRGSSWHDSIVNGRIQIDDLLENNPSLKSQLKNLIDKAYPKAKRYASQQTKLPLITFPEQCPFTAEQIISDWWPD